MRTIALVTAIAILVMAFAGHWILSIILYILMGIAWTKHDSSRPIAYGRMGYSTDRGTVFLFLIWPLIVICDCYESWQIISRGERFTTLDGDHVKMFSDWESVVDFARKKAEDSNEKQMISDRTVFTKQLGRIRAKSWWVHPDGKIEKWSRAMF